MSIPFPYPFHLQTLTRTQSNNTKLDRALSQHLPHITQALNASTARLSALSTRLPYIRTQVQYIRRAYDSGGSKARGLVRELEWVRAPVQERMVRTALGGLIGEEVPVGKGRVWGIRVVLLLFLVRRWFRSCRFGIGMLRVV